MLLHICCAPCGSSVLEKLKNNYEIKLYFYNPNIMPYEEYKKRLNDVRRLANIYSVDLIEPDYENDVLLTLIKGLENEPERGRRCEACIGLRLRKTAEAAKGFDCFTTTLTVSPHKNAEFINKTITGLGGYAEDFKKQDGYKRSIELSKEHGFYRQNYCGCVFIQNAL